MLSLLSEGWRLQSDLHHFVWLICKMLICTNAQRAGKLWFGMSNKCWFSNWGKIKYYEISFFKFRKSIIYGTYTWKYYIGAISVDSKTNHMKDYRPNLTAVNKYKNPIYWFSFWYSCIWSQSIPCLVTGNWLLFIRYCSFFISVIIACLFPLFW